MSRIDQFLSSLGYCSRREARAWIAAGRVTVRGVPAEDFGQKCLAADVRVDGEPLDHPDGLLLLLHKPVGVVCSHDTREGRRVYDLLPLRWQQRHPAVTSIGRLDHDTSGLLLLTDQTQLVHRLTSPKHKVPKVYLARLGREVATEEGQAIATVFAAGTLLLEGEKTPCLPATLRWRTGREAELTLTEGRYHQVRRMFASQGHTVVALHRETLGNLSLTGLEPGQWRELAVDQAIV